MGWQKLTDEYKAADTALGQKLTNEYKAADSVLENAYKAADTALYQKLTNEYTAADTAVYQKLTKEYTAADAVKVNRSDLDAMKKSKWPGCPDPEFVPWDKYQCKKCMELLPNADGLKCHMCAKMMTDQLVKNGK